MTQPAGTRDLIQQALSLLCEPGQVIELRVPGTDQGTQSGYFDDMQKLVEAAANLDGKGPGIYITLNPVNPVLLARRVNRVKAYVKQGDGTGDKDILSRRCFPIDFDAIRPAGISSTDEEHAAAINKAVECREWLKDRGWPEPILADSGNGAHLPYRVELPNDEASKNLLEQCLKALGALFDDEQVKVDQTTFNASRIWKLYGTTVCKGDHLPDRPHRMAHILEAPDSLEPVGLELLQQLADIAPVTKKPEPRAATNGSNSSPRLGQGDYTTLAVVDWFESHSHYGLQLADIKHSVRCPWSAAHSDVRADADSDTVIWEATDGQWPTFHCSHDHCIDRDLKSVMDLWGDADSFCTKVFQPSRNDTGHDTIEPPISATPLRFRSAAEIARETPAQVPWIAEPWIAEGSVTELDGKIKAGGKTTWLLALCRKTLDGQPFMGVPTVKTPVVYLTEQPMSSFREALRRADLLEREDFRVLPYHDTIGTPWPQVVEAALKECQRIGAKLLAVDTLPQFADISGESENSSGAALTALGPIQAVAAGGIGVVGVRHDRKAGGDVGDSGRGSSAWGGGVRHHHLHPPW